MESHEAFGRIKHIGNPVASPTGFIKTEFVIATDEQYPQMIKFELHGQKFSLISPFFVGDSVQVFFNLRGKEWINPEGKAIYFNSFVCWRIKKLENGYVVPTSDASPHVQHGFNFPPADEVFGKPTENVEEFVFDRQGNAKKLPDVYGYTDGRKNNQPFREEDHSDLPF